MTSFRVLFVCVGNVCRSPLGQLLLTDRLPAEGFEVASAGTNALVGSPMSADAVSQLELRGVTADGFTARQLTGSMVDHAHLVLTATREIRGRVLEETPTALRRTFTVRELAALLDVVPPEEDPSALVAAAARERSRATLEDYDVPDPFRRGEEANALAARLMDDAVGRIATGLTTKAGART